MNYEALFLLANKAKDFDMMSLANIVFAVLLVESRDFNTRLFIEWETADIPGEEPEEAFYDLVYVCYGEQKLCCPAPMIQTPQIISALKRNLTFVNAHIHDRQFQLPSPQEESLLWEEFKALATEQLALAAITAVFNLHDGHHQPLHNPLMELVMAKFK